MTRYTFDPRLEFTLDDRRRHCRTFSVGIVDHELVSLGGATIARIKGPSEHADAIRAAAQAYCDTLNGVHRMASQIDDMQRIQAVLKGGRA